MTAGSSAESFADGVADVVASIPAGRVMAYGDVAAMLGSRAARAVGRVMATEGGSLPWWRVVRASGLPPARHEAAALARYQEEETPLLEREGGWRIDMRAARWSPDADDDAR